MLKNIGIWELVLILLILLLVFGAAKLPEIARAIGKAIKEFKKEVKDTKDSVEDTEKNKK